MTYSPIHPGKLIKELCVTTMDITVTEAARRLGVDRKIFLCLINGRLDLDSEMALKIARAFGISVNWYAPQKTDTVLQINVS